jgi:hypothetical protein
MVVSKKQIPYTLVQKECFPLYELHWIEFVFGLPSGGNLPKKKKMLGQVQLVLSFRILEDSIL